MNSVIILNKQHLQTCSSIPNQRGTICTIKLNFGGNLTTGDVSESFLKIRLEQPDEDNGDDENSVADANLGIPTTPEVVSPLMEENCILSLAWFGELMEDAKREDVVTLLFQVWLFSLALVAILNESIPHLGAGFLGHVLGTGWAGFRIRSTHSMTMLYRNKVVPEACGGIDVMGSWWEVRMQHSIPILVVNALTLLAFMYLSTRLCKVYANESFSRVGASATIHRLYKIILLFSVCLQLSGFLSLASIGMWIDKICHGLMREMAKHSNLYLAAFVVILVFQLPWLWLGWLCVRKESRSQFAVFFTVSGFLLALSTAMFFSSFYRYIFTTWPFFATLTVTAYILIVATSVLAVMCRLNFGKGLAHYLQVTEALEGVDFTPVSFSKGYDSDAEKIDFEELKRSTRVPFAPITLQLPTLSFQDQKRQSKRGSSTYFEPNGNPLSSSSSPPLVSETGPTPRRYASSKAPFQSQSIYTPGLRGLTYNSQPEVGSNSRTIKLHSGRV